MTITDTLWRSLETGNLPPSGLVFRRFPAAFLPEISAAIQLPGMHPALAVGLMDVKLLQNVVSQTFRDLKISIREDILIIELQKPALREIFAVLCDDLALHLKYETNTSFIAQELQNRLYQWSLLFEKANSSGLSAEEQRGLFGELIILEMLLEKAPEPLSVLDYWQGPSGGYQDFFFTNRAIEVKTTFGNKHQKVTISNVEQLDESKLAFLWLSHIAIEDGTGDNDAKTLNDIVEHIFVQFCVTTEAANRFWAKLAEAGYFETQRSLYDQPAYYIRNIQFYQVRGEFPRIRPNEIRSGVESIKYSIHLSDCLTWLTEISFIFKNLPFLRNE